MDPQTQAIIEALMGGSARPGLGFKTDSPILGEIGRGGVPSYPSPQQAFASDKELSNAEGLGFPVMNRGPVRGPQFDAYSRARGTPPVNPRVRAEDAHEMYRQHLEQQGFSPALQQQIMEYMSQGATFSEALEAVEQMGAITRGR